MAQNMEEQEILCSVCFKSFSNSTAVNNHRRIEHVDLSNMEDPEKWTRTIKKPLMGKNENPKVSKTENQIISQMSPESLAQISNGEVSYVMLSSQEVDQILKEKKMKRRKVAQADEDSPETENRKTGRKPFVKKTKEPNLPMSFQCPQALPSGEICNQVFPDCCSFSTHFRDDHTRKKKSNKCQVCEKLLLPEFVDDGTPYKCSDCGKGFHTDKQLKKHAYNVHPRDKPFKCGVCDRSFTQKSNLLQHMRLHTGEKPFKCGYCARDFRQKSVMTHHLRVHTKEKPYKCVVCDKTFSQYGILRQHMRVHTKIAPFRCHVCQHTFKQCHHLSNHLKNFHNLEVEKPKKVLLVDCKMEPDYPEVKVEEFEDVVEESIETEVCSDEMLVVEQ